MDSPTSDSLLTTQQKFGQRFSSVPQTSAMENTTDQDIDGENKETDVIPPNEGLSQEWVWGEYLKQMQRLQSEATYSAWILTNPITRITMSPDGPVHITFTSPSPFHAANLERQFNHQIKQILEGITLHSCVIQYEVQTSSASPGKVGSFSRALQASPDAKKPASPRAEDLFSEATVSSMAEERLGVRVRSAGLRADYTFETFAVSTTNEMAHAAATAVAEHPGVSYNPLFFYGGVGVGKTHLMQAIGHSILERFPDSKLLYCTGEEFTNEIVQAIQSHKTDRFKEKYRKVDVLLIDDIQFIAGKNTVQEEFFHTFNALTKNQKQVVLTSDRPPQEIALLEDRIRSRFEAGLMIDIQQPSFELRTAIVLTKAKAQRVVIPINLAQEIATHVDSARRIEGIITIIRSEVELKGQVISPELIAKILSAEKPSNPGKHKLSELDVIKAVANHFHITQTALKGQSRVKHLVTARHLCMYILKQDAHLTLVEIGRWFSNRDHTSVMHAIGKVEKEIAIFPQLNQDLHAIRTTLASSTRG